MTIKLFSFVFVAIILATLKADQGVVAFPLEHTNTPRSVEGHVGSILKDSRVLARSAPEEIIPVVEKPIPVPANNPTDPIHHRRAVPAKSPAPVVEKPVPAKKPTDPIHHRRAVPAKIPAPVVEKPALAKNPTDPIHHRRSEPPKNPIPLAEKPKPIPEVPIPPPHLMA